MIAVRYMALAALVVWLGGMIALQGLVAPTGHLVDEVLQRFELVAYACGTVLFVSLFLMKFIGPPPAAFAPRAALVAAMMASTAYSGRALSLFNMALGFVLLYWYARE